MRGPPQGKKDPQVFMKYDDCIVEHSRRSKAKKHVACIVYIAVCDGESNKLKFLTFGFILCGTGCFSTVAAFSLRIHFPPCSFNAEC